MLRTNYFKFGSRVYYISGKHGRNENNPLKGTKYECIGTIINIDPMKNLECFVQWDNGETNSYYFSDLETARYPIKINPFYIKFIRNFIHVF